MINFKQSYLIDTNNQKTHADFRIENNNNNLTIFIKPKKTVTAKEVVLFEGPHNFSKTASFYADGYQMLSQYGGTIDKILNLTPYSDKSHYKMPQTNEYSTVYNYAYITDNGITTLIGATSCNHFRIEIRINKSYMQIVQCLEGITLTADKEIQLESMTILSGEKNKVLSEFAKRINLNHPRKTFNEYPTGWCSWYCVGPNISEQDIAENLTEIKRKIPELKYIQIDDGFQPFMGDWLETGNKFTRPMAEICADIRNSGFEPAIWLAPFIASPKSRLFREHPEFFIKDIDGTPLRSDCVTFGGWRDGPWYFLDSTHPDVQSFLYETVHKIYKEWGVKYFKLDANVWGALPFGVRYDSNTTSIDAYRKGMEIIWKAVENDAFILGCNAPMWPSLGEVTAMRITADFERNLRQCVSLAKQCFYRNWMHNSLWINDPDCIVLENTSKLYINNSCKIKSKKSYKYNNIYVRASGGIILSGDFIKRYSAKEVELLKRIISSPHIAAEFNDSQEIGKIAYENTIEYCIFNNNSLFKKYEIHIPHGYTVVDMYNGKAIKTVNGKIQFGLSIHDCKWIKMTKV